MPYDTTEEDLGLACEAFGNVESATIIKDKNSGQPKGFGGSPGGYGSGGGKREFDGGGRGGRGR